ncbi:MAG: hypothetical protein RR446_07965 [Lachnospiraceae bacterium]
MDKMSKQDGLKQGIAIDMKRISDDLREQEQIFGAFCQSYEEFKTVYRFVERSLKRSESSSYIILFTLTDMNGDFPPLAEREKPMESLSQVIQMSLRMGDVFSQYSSGQFLTMVPNTTEQDADRIAKRIQELFYQKNPEKNERILLHHSYPVIPANAKKI